ncbi:MAG: MafB family polymorphic toxin [Neisseriaceae bacterium]|nr:MafB family polymorphic toxin [Neisseriaceae bacterium]
MKNPFKKLSGSLKHILGVTTLATAVLLSPVANAELANDPFIRDGVTNRKNFEPGGKYHLFGSARGTVTNRGGQINIDTLNHLKVGNLDIEQGIIHGEITYHTDFRGQGHTWEVHSPFDEHASRSKSDKNDIIGVSSTAYSIEWTGDLKHPADGYDAPIGGGYPNPTGARDEYTYKVKGIADSVDIELAEQPDIWQRFKNRGTNAWGSLKNIGSAWQKGTTHNPNLNGWGNLAESGNALLEGVGSALNAPWELIGGNDAVQGLGVARDALIMLELNRASPETQLSEVNWLVQGKLGYDGLKESYARWEAENPNAAQFAGLGWNALENWVTKKGNTTGSYSNIEPYNRQKHYGGSQTNSSAAQAARQAGEGKPCPTCGQTQVSGTSTAPSPQHEPPLVKHYYEHGGSQMTPAQRKEYAKNEGINGTQCLTCQRKEGGKLSQYAKNKKKGNK